MNEDEILRDATNALREEADASRARPDETRARLMRTLSARRSRRLTAIRVFVPLAAVLIGSVAWASATHRLPEVWYEMASKLGLGEVNQQAPETPEAPARRTGKPKDSPLATGEKEEEPNAPVNPANDEDSPRTDESVVPAPEEQVAGKAEEPVRTPIRVPASAPSAASPPASHAEPAAPASAPVDPDAHALYQAAHRAHFADRNPSAALVAWDAYLKAAPRGRFAVEARYNRALCLVRLGRMNEARRTLETFANAPSGSYRQAEARALLDAMNNASQQ